MLRQVKPKRVLLLGDIFAKGPDPAGVWTLIQEHGLLGILGNHDARLLEVWGKPGDSKHHQAAAKLDDASRTWTEALPLTRLHIDLGWPGPWRAVHAGVHPTLGWPSTTRRQALNLRRWPDDADEQNPFWWQLYAGTERILYGHDALRGVQHHELTIGLDSGCVYGGELSGWIAETGEIVTVPFSG